MKSKFILTCFCFLCLQNIVFASSDLIITEVYPDPLGDEKSGEFIEIYNPTPNDIDITNYSIEDSQISYFNSETPFLLKSNEFVIIHDNEIDIKQKFQGNYKRAAVENLTARGLANTTDSVVLKKDGTIIDTVEYSESLEGVSIVRPMQNCNLLYNITDAITSQEIVSPGTFDDIFKLQDLNLDLEFYNGNTWQKDTNFSNLGLLLFRLTNHEICPLVSNEFEYTVNTSNSLICNNAIQLDLGQNYNFNLTIKHKFTDSKKVYSIKVTNEIITPIPSPTANPSPTINPTQTPIATPNVTPTPIPTIVNSYKDIRINEVYPSPDEGENEWVELYNFGTENINLNDWKLSDLSTTQNLTGIINAKSYVIIEATHLKISLNNAGDEITLKNPAGNIVDILNYPSISKTKSYAEIDGVFSIINIPSKGSANKGIDEITPTPTPLATQTPIPSPTSQPNNGGCQCPLNTETLDNSSLNSIISEPVFNQVSTQIKLPLNYVVNPSPGVVMPEKPENTTENNRDTVAQNGGLFLLGMAGLVSTPTGKDIVSIILKKLESMGA